MTSLVVGDRELGIGCLEKTSADAANINKHLLQLLLDDGLD
jgi:hypothetical protein